MATQASTILTAAINLSLANDGGTSPLANNTTELLGVLSRTVRHVYAQAGLPPSGGGGGYTNYFTRTTTLTLGTPNTTPRSSVVLLASGVDPPSFDSDRLMAAVRMVEAWVAIRTPPR